MEVDLWRASGQADVLGGVCSTGGSTHWVGRSTGWVGLLIGWADSGHGPFFSGSGF